MNNMKIIMKEWRSFVKEVDRSKILLSESSSLTLADLLQEYKSKNISRKDYVQALCESLDEDLRWLRNQDVKILGEALGGVSAAFSKIKSAVVEKIKGMLAKALDLAKSAGKKAIDYAKQIDNFVEKFKTSNPTAYGLIKDLLKLVSVAAVAYLVYKYGISSASAEVAVRQAGGDVVNLTGQAQAVIDVLGDSKFQEMSGIDAGDAANFIKAIKSGKKLDFTDVEGLNNVLRDAISVAKGRATMAGNPFADVFNSAASVVQGAAGQVAQAAQAAGGVAKTALQLAKSLTMDDVREAMKYLDDAHKNDPEAIARALIKVTKKIQANDAGVDLVVSAVKKLLGAS